jgi:hypothetical protein
MRSATRRAEEEKVNAVRRSLARAAAMVSRAFELVFVGRTGRRKP